MADRFTDEDPNGVTPRVAPAPIRPLPAAHHGLDYQGRWDDPKNWSLKPEPVPRWMNVLLALCIAGTIASAVYLAFWS